MAQTSPDPGHLWIREQIGARNSARGRPMAGLTYALRQARRYLRTYRHQNLLVILTILIDIAFRVTFFYEVKVLLNDAVAHRAGNTVALIIAGLAAFFMISALSDFVRDSLTAEVDVKLGNTLRLDLLQHLHQLSADFYDRAHVGDLQTRFFADTSTIRSALTKDFPYVVHRSLQFVTYLIFLVLLNWQMTALMLMALVLSLLVPWLVASRLRAPRSVGPPANAGLQSGARERPSAEAALMGEVQEQLTGNVVIRAFGLGPVMLRSVADRLATAQASAIKSSRTARLFKSGSTMRITFTTFTVTAAGVIFVYHGALSVGSLVAFVGVMGQLGSAGDKVLEGAPAWLAGNRAFERIDGLLSEQPAVLDTPDATPLPNAPRTFRFRHVGFGYNPDEKIVDDVNFTVPTGHSLAIVGRSGSGKSTLLSLLLRLYDPIEGEITVDGRDLRSVTLESLHAQFGVVFQESFLFDRTIRENIRMGRLEASDAEIEHAARAAQIHDVITRLPNGYDTRVGDRGGRLSAGEKQRVALARALVRNPSMLVLDEATSALDPASEAAFNDTLQQLANGRTMVSVTHRLSTAVEADRIIVLDRGQVAEQGTHEELLRLQGDYHRMWELQTGFIISGDGWAATVTPARLRRIPLFSAAENETLVALARQFVSRHYDPGDVVVGQGDRADSFFIVVRGTLDVLYTGPDGQERLVDRREDGEFFGEIGLLRDVPRTATVRATTPSLLLVLARSEFQMLMATFPELSAAVEQAASDRLERVRSEEAPAPAQPAP